MVMESRGQSILGFHFFSQGIPRITQGMLSRRIINSIG